MPKSKKKISIKPIHSLSELKRNSSAEQNPETYEKYRKLSIISAKNLGISQSDPTFEQCIRWLEANMAETNESGVVDEINFCLDLVE